ncbi:hypothetical protein BGZ65_012432 [Modicella reniformis]|uniref:Uncharacterized protein n=1 Tax=Modicella reniformis TaxID=1440133 RepID=A0A9P6MKH3_9FUNG|nr:hypothetical protein BGZ65_012432 [Modicella reniformis]
MPRNSNRNSTCSARSLGSSMVAGRISRPLSANQEHVGPFSMTAIGDNPGSASTKSLGIVTRAKSDPQSGASRKGPSARAKARATQHSYSRQLTLSAIPANEEVPFLPGKLTSKTSKVRIQLIFDRPFFNAGGELSGTLEIQCSSSESIMLADVIIELLGYEYLYLGFLSTLIAFLAMISVEQGQSVTKNLSQDNPSTTG